MVVRRCKIGGRGPQWLLVLNLDYPDPAFRPEQLGKNTALVGRDMHDDNDWQRKIAWQIRQDGGKRLQCSSRSANDDCPWAGSAHLLTL
ncbi:hypothetical protein D3C71_1049950 [compost metagenome]